MDGYVCDKMDSKRRYMYSPVLYAGESMLTKPFFIIELPIVCVNDQESYLHSEDISTPLIREGGKCKIDQGNMLHQL